MAMPEVHVCAQLGSENEALKRTLRKLKQQNMDMLRQLNDIREKQRMDAMMKQFVTTRNMEVQTDPQRSMMSNLHVQFQKQQEEQKKAAEKSENERLNKMMLMHSNLMRRYEKELKMNVTHVETITTLNLKLNELEQKLKESQILTNQLEADNLRNTKKSDDRYLQKQLQTARRERDKLASENYQLKKELGGLDQGFFEEVEDLKYALQQSTVLNQEYEKSLRKLTTRFGVPYPNPGKTFLQI